MLTGVHCSPSLSASQCFISVNFLPSASLIHFSLFSLPSFFVLFSFCLLTPAVFVFLLDIHNLPTTAPTYQLLIGVENHKWQYVAFNIINTPDMMCCSIHRLSRVGFPISSTTKIRKLCMVSGRVCCWMFKSHFVKVGHFVGGESVI